MSNLDGNPEGRFSRNATHFRVGEVFLIRSTANISIKYYSMKYAPHLFFLPIAFIGNFLFEVRVGLPFRQYMKRKLVEKCYFAYRYSIF